jgi:hypothetical protein
LEITAGFLGETELHHPSWASLHAYLYVSLPFR